MTEPSQTIVADSGAQALPDKDRWALPLTIAMAALVFAAKLVPSARLGDEGFTAVHALFCAACVLVLVRRFRVLVGAEAWIVCNLAVLYNPIWPFRLYDQQLWVGANVITTVSLARFLYRTTRPDDRWSAGLTGFLIGVYVASLVAEDVVAGNVNSRVREVLALPVSLAATSVLLYFVVGWAIVTVLGARDFLESWGISRKARPRKTDT